MGTRLAALDTGADVLTTELLLAQQAGVDKKVTPRDLPFSTDHITGLAASNNTTDSDHDIDIAVGECRDVDDAVNMVLSSGLTKQIDAAWAVGTNAGGLDAGTVAASEVYLLWLIKRTDTGVVDALFMRRARLLAATTITATASDSSYNDSGAGLAIFEAGQQIYIEGFATAGNNGLKTVVTSTAAKLTVSESVTDEAAGPSIDIATENPKLPASYDAKRLIGAVITDVSSNISPFFQLGDYFEAISPVVDASTVSVASTASVVQPVSAPKNAEYVFTVSLFNATAASTASSTLLTVTREGSGTIGYSIGAHTGAAVKGLNYRGKTYVDEFGRVRVGATYPDGAVTYTLRGIGFFLHSRSKPNG